MAFPTLRRQSYQTKLTFSKAIEIAKQPFIYYIDPIIAFHSADDDEIRDDSNYNP